MTDRVCIGNRRAGSSALVLPTIIQSLARIILAGILSFIPFLTFNILIAAFALTLAFILTLAFAVLDTHDGSFSIYIHVARLTTGRRDARHQQLTLDTDRIPALSDILKLKNLLTYLRICDIFREREVDMIFQIFGQRPNKDREPDVLAHLLS